MKIKGFTLVELMVTISIIAIIATIAYTNYANAQMVARDGKRLSDLKTIQVGLELYYARHGHYPRFNSVASDDWPSDLSTFHPDSPSCIPGPDCWQHLFGSNPQDFINQMPVDPQNGQHHYFYYSERCGQAYGLMADMEIPTNNNYPLNSPYVHQYRMHYPNPLPAAYDMRDTGLCP